MNSRRTGLCLIALAFSCIPARAAEPARQPNIILIVCDSLGQRDLGCYGSTFHQTPNIDALAKQGIRFTDFSTVAPSDVPTMASMLTGKYPQRLGIVDANPAGQVRTEHRLKPAAVKAELPPAEVTLAQALKTAGYATGQIATSAQGIEFFEQNKAKPFFLHIAHSTSLSPLKEKPEGARKFAGKPSHGKQSNPEYAESIGRIDESVGTIVARLEALKLTDNTIMIFTSASGGQAMRDGLAFAPTFNGPFREGAGYLYEGGIRVPLIVKWSGTIKPGTVCAEVASSLDLFPTILEACAVKSASASDGLSLLGAIKGIPLPARVLYWHVPHYSSQGGRPGGAIREGSYKLIEYYEDGRRELYDLKADPSESRNLIRDKAALAIPLVAKLAEWRAEVGARMPIPNPDFIPNPPDKDGAITLHARTATIHGVQLRYEPLPHKETLGFWVEADDWASFDFTVATAGLYRIEVLQGCGKGSGGAEVELAVGDRKVVFIVKETGGFQAFEKRDVGTITLDKAGCYTMSVRAKTKPGAAVMDVRQIVLTPEK